MAPETNKDTNKYMFDLNNFDAGIGFDAENPPAPTFSEEELATAKQQGFNDGVKKGLADAAASRDQQVAQIVQKLGADISILLNAEAERARKFETELLTMVQALFIRAFPVLNHHFAQTQITATITEILQNLGENTSITIEISPTDLEEVSDRLRPLLSQHTGAVSILPQSDLDAGSFRLRWKDGGAIRDTQTLAEKITNELGLILAQTGQNGQTET